MDVAIEKEKRDAIVAALRAGQKPDGGWSNGDGPSEFGATYRIMRAFFMLKEKPDLGRLRALRRQHRQSDGGYAPAPGGAADLGGDVSSARSCPLGRQLDGEPAIVETAGFVPCSTART